MGHERRGGWGGEGKRSRDSINLNFIYAREMSGLKLLNAIDR